MPLPDATRARLYRCMKDMREEWPSASWPDDIATLLAAYDAQAPIVQAAEAWDADHSGDHDCAVCQQLQAAVCAAGEGRE